jgi:hypothetical protein
VQDNFLSKSREKMQEKPILYFFEVGHTQKYEGHGAVTLVFFGEKMKKKSKAKSHVKQGARIRAPKIQNASNKA